MKVKYTHYRIPERDLFLYECVGRVKGQPDKHDLVQYSRKYKQFLGLYVEDEPSKFGGLTVCVVTDDDGNNYVGKAVCSMSDYF